MCSAAKDVRVWDAKTRLQLHVLPVGCWVYSLAVCATSMGKAQTDTLYAGCKDGKIRSWKLGQLAASESGGAGALNARECDDSTMTGPRARSSLSNGEYPKASAQPKAPSAKTSAAPWRASPICGCQSSGAL